MTKLYYEVIVNSSIEHVFNTMFQVEYYQKWTSAFNADSRIEGTLAKKAQVSFLDANDNGMICEVSNYQQNKAICFKYLGEINNGNYKPYKETENYESYNYQAIGDEKTKITVEILIPDYLAASFATMWKKALILLSELYNN